MSAVNKGVCWKYVTKLSQDKHRNWQVKCNMPGCGFSFTGSHGRVVGHFDANDHSIVTCGHATPEVIADVGRFLAEKKTKKDAKRKREESQELAQADKVKRSQTRMTNLANRYSSKELNIESVLGFRTGSPRINTFAASSRRSGWRRRATRCQTQMESVATCFRM